MVPSCNTCEKSAIERISITCNLSSTSKVYLKSNYLFKLDSQYIKYSEIL